MNKYLRGLFVIPMGIAKTFALKLAHFKNYRGVHLCQISPCSEITIDGGKLEIGKGFKMRDGAKIRVRKNSVCIIGKNFSMSSNNIITCRKKIVIGDNVVLSPNVCIYDHDHDFRAEGGIKAGLYKTSPIIIGDNCWIGANVVILRGAKLGNNCVVAAGTIVKGQHPDNCVIYNEKIECQKSY